MFSVNSLPSSYLHTCLIQLHETICNNVDHQSGTDLWLLQDLTETELAQQQLSKHRQQQSVLAQCEGNLCSSVNPWMMRANTPAPIPSPTAAGQLNQACTYQSQRWYYTLRIHCLELRVSWAQLLTFI